MLNNLLERGVKRLYPEITLSRRAEFQPMLDLAKGTLSSTAAIEVARITRESPQRIAEAIVRELDPSGTLTWRSDLGYIVLSTAELPDLLGEVREVREVFAPERETAPSPRDVVVLTPDLSVPAYAWLRLLALGATQALLAVLSGSPCRMTLVPRPARTVSSRAEVIEELQAAIGEVLEDLGRKRPDPLAVVAHVTPGRTTLLTAHHYHDQLPKSVKAGLASLKSGQIADLRMPGDGWLMARDRALAELLAPESLLGVLKRLQGQEGWMRWLLHAVSSVPSGDLDPMVALFDECASPLWSARTLAERFEALFGTPSGNIDRAALGRSARVEAGLRPLALRGLFLPMWWGLAVREGEVLAWMTALEELSSAGHALLNRPDVRRAASQGNLSEGQLQILASLSFGLSSILPVVSEGGSCAQQVRKV